jgi:uncharacterized phage protein (TIGR01671 family)
MNREIKFRVWHKKLEKIFMIRELCFGAYIGYLNENYLYTAPIEDVELMQFTGLLDKSGREIYEGDIVKYPLGCGDENCKECSSKFRVQKIEYEHLEYMDMSEERGVVSAGFHIPCGWEGKMEVIGNIFENPELVGVDL